MVAEKSSETLPPCRREFITIKNTRKIKNAIEVVGPADGLPDGWLKKIWSKNTGGKIRKDPYYEDPVSGFEFRSKKDALRYLETGDFSKCKMKPKKIDGTDLQSTEVVIVKSTDVDGLPPGWIKEVEPRKVGKRKDRFYVDPVSGFMFWSKLDALRYIDSGDIRKCANKPKKRGADGNVSTQIVCQESSPMERTSGQLLISDGLNNGKHTSNSEVPGESLKRMQENSWSVTGRIDNLAEVTPETSLRSKERKSSETLPISEPRPEGSEEKDLSTASSIGTVVLDIQAFLTGIIEQKTESSRRASIDSIPMACEDFTVNPVPSAFPQPQPLHANLPVADVDTSHEQNLPNDSVEQKNGYDTPVGLKTYKRKEASNSSRASKRYASQSMPNFNTSGMSSKTASGSQLEPSPVTTASSVPLPATITQGELPACLIDGICGGNLEPLNTVPAPELADIVPMTVESITNTGEMERNEQPSINDQAAVSAETRIQLDEKPSFENLKPHLSAVDPSLDFAFKTFTGAIAVEDTNGRSHTYPIHGNGHFGSSGSHNRVNSHQRIPSHFQSSLANHGSSQAQSNPSALARNGSFGQSGSNFTSFQQHTPTRFTSSWQHVRSEQPRHPPDGLPPFRGIRIMPDTRSKDYLTYRGFIN